MVNADNLVILMAEDDEDDRIFTAKAFQKAWLSNELRFVENGEELMDYLFHRGNYSDPAKSPRPGLILLDLNMPRKSGLEALAEIKAHPDLKLIPVVVLTSSSEETDILKSYGNGANSFITKPVTFEKMVETVKELRQYWFKIVCLPPENG